MSTKDGPVLDTFVSRTLDAKREREQMLASGLWTECRSPSGASHWRDAIDAKRAS